MKRFFPEKKARSMLFSKNLRSLALGLIVATGASMGFANPVGAEVFFDIAQTTAVNPGGSLNGDPRQFVADSVGNPISLNLSGSDFAGLQGFTVGSLAFISTSSNNDAYPVMPLTLDSFSLTSAFNGAGSPLITGSTGSATLTDLGGGSVLFEGTGVADVATVGVTGIKFAITFTNANKPIPTGGVFPQFTAFSATGSITTIPEPSSLALLALGGLGLGVRAYRRRQAIVA